MSVNTRISPVGYYNPVDRLFTQAPAPTTNPTPNPVGQGVGNFFHDVWVGGKDQFKDDLQMGLHPVESAKQAWADLHDPAKALKKLTNPYVRPIRNGHSGKAVGRLLANVAVIGGLVLGARALLGGGGGASVGTAGPLDNILGPVGKVLGGVTHAVGNVVGGVFHFAGSIVRGIFGFGGGAHVGFR